MPYAPGVQDISGQLRSQGTVAKYGGIASGVSEGVQEYQKNKFLAGQAIAKFEAMAGQDPDMIKYLESEQAPSAVGSAINKLHRDGTVGMKDAAVLAQFAESYSTQKRAQQESQARQQQMALQSQQANEYAQRIQLQKQQMEVVAAEQKDNNVLRRAIEMATDPKTGQINSAEVVKGYVKNDGRDQKKLADVLESLDKLNGKAEFKAKGYDVEMPGGAKRQVIQTSNGAVQVLPQATDTAAMQNLDMKVRKVGEIKKLMDSGKEDEAYQIAIALGLPGQLGGLITKRDLQEQFGTKTKDSSPVATNPTPAATGSGRFKIIAQ